MLPRDEVIKAIERRNPSRVPVWDDWFAGELWQRHGQALADLMAPFENDFFVVEYGPPRERQVREDGKLVWANRGRSLWYAKSLSAGDAPTLPPNCWMDEWGVISRHLEGGVGGQAAVPPLNDWTQLDDYLAHRAPTFTEPGRFDPAAQLRSEYPDAYIMGHWWLGIFERMCFLRGMGELLADLHLERCNVLRLGEALLERFLTLIQGFGAAGCDCVWFSDDWGAQHHIFINPELWRQVFKPWYKAMIDECHRLHMHAAFHSCGAMEAIIPDLIEIGLDILNPIQPYCNDLERVVREYGGQICFFGGLDVQHILPNCAPEEVAAECRRLIDLFDGPNGGYIACPANTVMPETPLANIEAMCRTFREYGVRRNGGHGGP